MHYSFEFDEFDNPQHLSKVGNWVITFLTSAEQTEFTQLAITNVIPRQATQQLQPRRLIIEQKINENDWEILQLECFDGEHNQEIRVEISEPIAQKILQQFIAEFAKYDVHLSLKKLV